MTKRSLLAVPVIALVMALALYMQRDATYATKALDGSDKGRELSWSDVNPLRLLSPDRLVSSITPPALPATKTMRIPDLNLKLDTKALNLWPEEADARLAGIEE